MNSGTSTANICKILFSLHSLLQNVSEEPGKHDTSRMAEPLLRLLTVWTGMLQQASGKLLLFFPPERLVGCFSDLKCHTVT